MNKSNLKFRFIFFIITIFLTFFIPTSSKQQNYCDLQDPEFLITFHPHLDAFWLNTDDQLKSLNFRPAGFLYAMNQRNSKTILNSMYQALQQNSTRKYFVTQVVFFKDWYDFLPSQRRQKVKDFIQKGQLQIANGGWVQNDQAVCYYDDILDQYTLGHNFLYDAFGYVVKIGWATDSFGHSHSQVALQAILGIQFQGIQRVDDRYVNLHKDKPLLQFYWNPISDSNGKSYPGIVTQVRHFLHQVNDLRTTNTDMIKSDFIRIQKTLIQKYQKNKVFRFLGNDFEQFIPSQFQHLQQAMSQMNKKSGCVQYKYGNPTDYLNLIKQHWSVNNIPQRKYDFIPNWDQDRYWVGYYTTDPQLKKVCKDFSRLLNLYKKLIVKNNYLLKLPKDQLKKADQLLSVVQHHDGITATSKTHIQRLFKQRMRNTQNDIIKSLAKINEVPQDKITQLNNQLNQDLRNIQYPNPNLQHQQQITQNQIVCKLYQNNNVCRIKKSSSTLVIKIIHEGNKKKQRVQFVMPNNNTFYKISATQFHIFCINSDAISTHAFSKAQQCRIVFDMVVQPGINTFVFKRIDKNQIIDKIIHMQSKQDKKYVQGNLSFQLKNNQLIYTYALGQFMKFGYYQSKASFQRRDSVAWDKYGQRNNKFQNPRPGMYIMYNDGKLQQSNFNYNNFYIGVSQKYIKVIITALPVYIQITIDKSSPNLVDLVSNFRPASDRQQMDYFLKVQSHVSNKQEFYHDSNGYLVAKRILNSRPDYQFSSPSGDKINANTYPSCSFVFMKNSQQKFVSFVDRAQGVTLYQGTFLFNVDRLAGDDYKGAGQGYMFVLNHMFSQKFGIVSIKNDIQRIWQRKYDEPLIAFIEEHQQSNSVQVSTATLHEQFSYLKYNVFILNSDEIVLRLHNLAQKQDIKIPKYTSTKFLIPQLGLSLQYTDIKQTFANGNILKDRRKWTQNQVAFKPGSKDTSQSLILQPLQIRSFRINFNNAIQDKQKASGQVTPLYDVKPLHMSFKTLRKRCW